MILAGDLGGTKANLGLFDVKAGQTGPRRRAALRNAATFRAGRNHQRFSEWGGSENHGGVFRDCRAGRQQSRAGHEFSVGGGWRERRVAPALESCALGE